MVPYLFWMIDSSNKTVNIEYQRSATIVNFNLVLIVIYTRFPKHQKSSNHGRVCTNEMKEHLPKGSLLNLLWSLEFFILFFATAKKSNYFTNYVPWNWCFQIFDKIHRKTPESEYLLNNVARHAGSLQLS